MTPADLSSHILAILGSLQSQGKLAVIDLPTEVVVERPKNRDHGDWATNVAMQWAVKLGTNPRELAQLLSAELEKVPGVSKVDIAGPGFINITLSAAAAGELAKPLVSAGSSYGTGEALAGIKMNLEFVSANPTGVELMFGEIRESLEKFGVHFDVFFHENSLYEQGAVQKAIQRLRDLGHIYDQDGAVWLRSTTFGDDRDRVVIKSDGEAAYIAGDLAYYLDKRERGFDQALYMLGADHHGYVQRMMAMCAAFGDEPGVNLEILIGQLVNLVKDGEPVRMSKRAGTVVTMEDLVDAVGVDAARYALTRSSINSMVDIDLDHLSKKTNDNPVFYVQYAHARTKQVANNATSLSVDDSEFDPSLLTHESESNLLAALARFPAVMSHASTERAPHLVARYLEEVAGAYHRWYHACRVTPLSGKEV